MRPITFFAATLVLLLPISVGFSATANARSAQSEFSDAWKAREDQYSAESGRLEAAARAAMAEVGSADPSNGTEKLTAGFLAVDAFAFMEGKQSMLRTFRALMNERPSAERSQLWFQEQSARIREKVQFSNAQVERAKQLQLGRDGVTPEQISREWSTSIWTSAILRGSFEELQLLADNAASYYQARDRERAQRNSIWASIFRGIGSAAQNYNNSMDTWTARCRTFMRTTTCTGN